MSAITLLDGGLGQELVHRAGDRPTPLWSTQVMIDKPGLVSEVHQSYFDAGAGVATTNSYAILRDRLAPAGIEDRFEELLDLALSEAETARAAHGSGRIAASIGPLGASYRPDLHPPSEQAVPIYDEVVRHLAPRADLILFETLSSLAAVRDALEAGKAAEKPVWIGVTVDDADGTRLRSGERCADLIPILQQGGAAAVLSNCSVPEVMPAALDVFAQGGIPFGAYANGFTRISEGFLGNRPTVDALSARDDLGPDAYAEHALRWVDQGATIIGGCCETGPAHIAKISRRLRDGGYQII